MKFFFVSLSMVLSIIFVMSGCGSTNNEASGNEEGLEYVNIGTAGTGGAYYPIGIAVAELLSEELSMNSSAEVTGGAIENVALVDSGEVEIAITQSPMAASGYEGTAPYEKEYQNISTLFDGLSRGVFQLVTSPEIESISDLEGKSVVMGPSGGGAVNVIEDILELYDLSLDDIDDTYVSYAEGISMLQDNNVDAVVVQSAAPASAITELAATNADFNLISLEKDEVEKITNKLPYLNDMEIPADMYNTEDDITTVYLTNMMIIRRDIDEEIVYNLTKSIFQNIEEVREVHPAAGDLTLENAADNVAIPLHPGAKRYFEEEGVLE